ncbi:transposase [Flavobacterium faecale]|uniref:transposase n=1 Tax=Flavobacterium faecale TaxID=1355330 RepID=UPI00131F063E
MPPYSPELNLIEILWRRIKYQWLDFDAYKSFENLKEKLNFVLTNFGIKYDIKF